VNERSRKESVGSGGGVPEDDRSPCFSRDDDFLLDSEGGFSSCLNLDSHVARLLSHCLV